MHVEDTRMERPSTRKSCIMSVMSCLYQLHFLEILTWSWMAQVPCGLQMATGNSHYNSSLWLCLLHLRKRIIKGNNLFANLVEVLTVFVVFFLLKNINYFKLHLNACSSTMRQWNAPFIYQKEKQSFGYGSWFNSWSAQKFIALTGDWGQKLQKLWYIACHSPSTNFTCWHGLVGRH